MVQPPLVQKENKPCSAFHVFFFSDSRLNAICKGHFSHYSKQTFGFHIQRSQGKGFPTDGKIHHSQLFLRRLLDIERYLSLSFGEPICWFCNI